MTREEFSKTKFSAGMLFKYDGQIYPVVSVDFTEGLFGLDLYSDADSLNWVRCESGELVESQKTN